MTFEEASEDDSTFMFSGLSVVDDEELIYDMDDDLTMVRSVLFDPTPSVCTMPSKSNSHATAPVMHCVHGLAEGPLTNIVLLYMIDYWHNRQPAKRASIQMHMLSGNDKLLDRVSYRVSTSQNELVVTIPLSTYMVNPERALYTVALDGIGAGIEGHKKVLDFHPKVSA